MLRTAILGTLALSCAWGVQAEPAADLAYVPSRAPEMVISSVTLDDLRMLADDVDAQVLEHGLSSMGTPYLVAQMPSGLTFGAYTVCAEAGSVDCRGIEFGVVFNRSAPIDVVAELDRSFVAVSIQRAGDEALHISRYVILDHGVTWANLIENLKVFELLCHHTLERLQPVALAEAEAPELDP